MLQLAIVLLLLNCVVVVLVPELKIQLVGVVAPSCTSQNSIRLLSLPVVPVVVLNTITPLAVEVFTPCTSQ